jgi:ribose transport system substrate-binding protein
MARARQRRAIQRQDRLADRRRIAITIRVCFAATVLAFSAIAPSAAETIATFTRNPSNAVLRSVRIGGEIAAAALGAQVVHFIPRSEAPPDQIALIDEIIRNKPAAIVVAPFDVKAMAAPVDRLAAAGIPVVNVNERLSGGTVISYVGTDDYALALATARHLLKAMGGKGNVVILEGPDNRSNSIARAKAFKDALREYTGVKLVESKSANYSRASAAEVMKGLLRAHSQIDGVLAANDPMAIGAVDALKAANKKALVVGINASTDVIDLIKSGDVLGSGDVNGFAQGCLGVEIAVRSLRKEPVPQEVVLVPVVVDKSNYQPYETPLEQRTCPRLESVAGK